MAYAMCPNGRVYLFTGSASGLTANPVWYADLLLDANRQVVISLVLSGLD